MCFSKDSLASKFLWRGSNVELHMSRTQCKWLKQKTSLIYTEFDSCEVRRLTGVSDLYSITTCISVCRPHISHTIETTIESSSHSKCETVISIAAGIRSNIYKALLYRRFFYAVRPCPHVSVFVWKRNFFYPFLKRSVSTRAQENGVFISSFTCGQKAQSVKKSCVFKNIRIRVDVALRHCAV